MPLKLLKGIRHFKNNALIEKQGLLRSLSKGQSPDVLFITCSDSRIAPTFFTHSDLGVLFEMRNAGNIVTPYAPASSADAATLEFGIVHLDIKDIVVCGHSHCGAMKGVMSSNLGAQLPCTETWLSQCRTLLPGLKDRHPDLKDHPELALKYLTQDNVLEQIEHLQSYPFIKERLDAGTLKLHAWYYEFEHGEVYIYNREKNTFIPFEDTVIEVALSYIQKTIEEETLLYLKNLVSHCQHDDLGRLCNEVEHAQQKIMWNDLNRKITEQLAFQLSELFTPSQEATNPQLQYLINTRLRLYLDSLPLSHECIQDRIEEPAYFLSPQAKSYSLFTKTNRKVSPAHENEQPSCCVIH